MTSPPPNTVVVNYVPQVDSFVINMQADGRELMRVPYDVWACISRLMIDPPFRDRVLKTRELKKAEPVATPSIAVDFVPMSGGTT